MGVKTKLLNMLMQPNIMTVFSVLKIKWLQQK